MKIAFIGIGMMGERMAGRLLAAGHDLTVYNRTRERTAGLAERGAHVASTPRVAAGGAVALITMLADPAAVDGTAEGADGFLAGLGAGALWIDMSTVSPAASRAFHARAGAHDVRMIDAPVSGSLQAAERGQLVVLAGGGTEDVEAARPLLDLLARAVVHLGPSGAGSATKLAVNAFLCTAMDAAAEAMRLAEAEGVERAAMVDVFSRTEVAPKWAIGKLERLAVGDVSPAFTMELAVKDLRLVEETARERAVPLPLLDAARAQYEQAVKHGLGTQDYSAVDLAVGGSR